MKLLHKLWSGWKDKSTDQTPESIALASTKPSVNHERLEQGLGKYCRIQSMYWQVDVSKSRVFQKAFNGFYRVRRNSEWQEHFYSLLERGKTEEMDFAQVLQALYEKTGNIEASFCSKLIATRYPDRPIIDRFVLENVGLALPKPYEQDRLHKTIKVYDHLLQRYADMLKDPKHREAVDQLREKYTEANSITDLKALDLILWQTRSGEK